MSTNDDSASRRGRRADQEEPAWTASKRQHRDERWDQPASGNRDSGSPYQGERGRESQPQQAAYSGFSRQSYAPPRQEQAPPPPAPPQPPRAYEPPQVPQGYYQEPVQRQDIPRSYVEPAAPYSPPPQAYEPVPQPQPYGDGGRDDLFSREPAAPSGYEQNPYGNQAGYRPEAYESAAARAAMMQPAAPPRREEQDYHHRDAPPPAQDYERGFAARIAAQETQASRFFLPEGQAPQQRPIQPERGFPPQAPMVPQAPMDRGYAPPSQSYNPGEYDPHGVPQGYERDRFDPRFEPQESWPGEEQDFHGEEMRDGHPPIAAHGDELDEDFFGDEDDFEHDDHPGAQKRGRKKLVAVLLAGAVAVSVGGVYLYKSVIGGGSDKATPFIHADSRPSKQIPGNPGGRQFPNGEKAIYERLTPDGRTQVASFAPPPPPPAPVSQAFAPPPAMGNSLEDRIDEALKRAQHTGDAPSAPSSQNGRPGPDQPTVVRSESYRPDGTKVDAARPVITPSIVSVDNGLPYPFGNATAPAPSQPAAAPLKPVSGPSQQQFATATAPAPRAAPVRTASRTPAPVHSESAPAAASGFYVSLKSAPDEKAIQRDLPGLTDKYRSVLGGVQLSSKIADLGAKGVTYRAVAGPLGTRQEAMELCQKIKGVGGDKACFVTN
ncbi:MAG: SPOR domain-containing protein [Rhodomicrobium sp.]